MKKDQDFYKEFEPDDTDLEEIARQVTEGFTIGHMVNGEGKRIYWELKMNTWEELEAKEQF